MIDPMTIRLNETLYRERRQAAAEARQQRTTWVAVPSPIDRLRQSIGRQLINLGQRLQPSAASKNTYRAVTDRY